MPSEGVGPLFLSQVVLGRAHRKRRAGQARLSASWSVFDEIRGGIVDKLAQPRERLAAPIAGFLDAGEYQWLSSSVLRRPRLH